MTAQDRILYLRQYAIRLKKSGTKVRFPIQVLHECWHQLAYTARQASQMIWLQIPRVELTEMGPSLDLKLRRARAPAAQVEKEAFKQPSLTKKKVIFLLCQAHLSSSARVLVEPVASMSGLAVRERGNAAT